MGDSTRLMPEGMIDKRPSASRASISRRMWVCPAGGMGRLAHEWVIPRRGPL